MNAPPATSSTAVTVVRITGVILLAALVAANLGTVDVDLIVLSIPVPVPVLAAAPAAAVAFGALRWNAASVIADRGRRERRREMDRLLGRRSSVPVRH